MNWTNEMQEFLQRLAPHLGCQCENLWRFEESRSGSFQVRVLLLNTTEEESLKLGWSDSFFRIKDARQDASRIALEWLTENYRNLVFKRGFLVLSSNSTCRARGLDSSPSVSSSMSELLNEKKFCFSDMYTTIIPKRKESQALNHFFFENDDSEFDDPVDFKNHFDIISIIQPASSPNALFQVNPGRLGEKYATQWIAYVTGSSSDEITWINKDTESGKHYDIEYSGGHPSMPSFIEVKSSWSNRKSHPSERQLEELFSNPDYGVLHIRNMKAMFDEVSPAPPTVVLFRLPPQQMSNQHDHTPSIQESDNDIKDTCTPHDHTPSIQESDNDITSHDHPPSIQENDNDITPHDHTLSIQGSDNDIKETCPPQPPKRRSNRHYDTLAIRKEAIPILIGKKGKNIKRIQEVTNCLLKVRSSVFGIFESSTECHQVEITAPSANELDNCTKMVTVEISFVDLDCALADLRKACRPKSSLGAIKGYLEFSLNCDIQLFRSEDGLQVTVRMRSHAKDPLQTNQLIRGELLDKLNYSASRKFKADSSF